MRKNKVIDIWKVVRMGDEGLVILRNLTNNVISKTSIGFYPGAYIGKIYKLKDIKNKGYDRI